MIRLLFSLLLLTFQFHAFAQKNKIVMVKKIKDIPKGRFIFTIIDRDTNQLYLGYSKIEPEMNQWGKKNIKGIRNGGHVQVLREAMGEINGTKESFLAKLEPKTRGRFIGGGFVLDDSDVIRIHPYFSHNAGGLIGDDIFTVNPLLHKSNSAMIPADLRDYFYSTLQANLSKKMQSTPGTGPFLGFKGSSGRYISTKTGTIHTAEQLQEVLDVHNKALSESIASPLFDLPKKPFKKRSFVKKTKAFWSSTIKCLLTPFRG